MTMRGFKEDVKEEEPEQETEKKEKDKVDKVEDFSDLETKVKEEEREKEKVTLQVMRVIGLKMNVKDMKQRIGMKAFGPMKMKQRGNPKPGMNGKKITLMSVVKTKEKDKVMGKVKQTM